MRSRFFVLSIIFHAIALCVLIFQVETSEHAQPQDPSKNSLQVRSLSERDLQKEMAKALESQDQQIAQGDDSLKSPKAPEKPNEKIYLSKNNQVVDHNTRAARFGKYKNVLKEGVLNPSDSKQASASPDKTSNPKSAALKKLFQLAPSEKDLEQTQSATAKTGRVRVASDRPQSQGRSPAGEGLSATDDYLEGVEIGANTLLNAKEFTFYSFYERIREKLAYEWNQNLASELNRLAVQGNVLGFDRRTKVEVQLDPKGQLTGLRVIGSSGLDELDRAATNAFKMASPFPNPPQGMIENKKVVSIRWDFVVIADADTGFRVEVKRSPAGF